MRIREFGCLRRAVVATASGAALLGCTAENVPLGAPFAYDSTSSFELIPIPDASGDDAFSGDEVSPVEVAEPEDAPSGDEGDGADASDGPDIADVLDLPDLPDIPDVADVSKPDTKDTAVADTPEVEADIPVTPPPSYRFVRVSDDPTNPSVVVCLAPTPGADIDAIEVTRDEEHLAFGGTITGDIDKDPDGNGEPCTNGENDVNAASGPPDASADGGSVSLNAGSITIELDGTAKLQIGDMLTVYEVGLAGAGVPERYSVHIAQKKTGPWLALGMFEGVQTFEVIVIEE